MGEVTSEYNVNSLVSIVREMAKVKPSINLRKNCRDFYRHHYNPLNIAKHLISKIDVKKMNILITGTSGFIGKHLLNFLRHSGNNLSILVRVMSKSPGWAGLNVYQGDICGSEISAFCREKDVVIHLAGIAHAPFFLNFIGGINAKRINIEGSLNLAKCARENGVKRFIYISSVKVNGDNTFVGARFTADDVPLPQDSYARQKLQVESELKKIF